jgi:MoxR-like ATPase
MKTKAEQMNQHLVNLIKARYPIIYVVSPEEDRVIDALAGIAEAMGKDVLAWSVTKGLHGVTCAENWADVLDAQAAKLRDPLAALQKIESLASSASDRGGALVVLRDFHAFLEPPQIQRGIRDLAAALLTSQGLTVMILSPVLNVPLTIGKEIAVVDYPLPDRAELLEIVVASEEAMPSTIKVNLNGMRQQLADALAGLTAIEAQNVLALAATSRRALDEGALDFIVAEKAQIVRKGGVLQFYRQKATWAEVGGLDLLVAWAQEAEAAFSEEAAQFGVEAPRGVLLAGIPGTGKSLAAKACAGPARPLLRLDVGALMSSLVGSSEANARQALAIAEAVAPCVLWIDEIEKSLATGGELDGGTSMRVLGTILTWMEETDAPVFVVATANDVGRLPPELVRRFDAKFWVDLPTAAGRAEIWNIHLAKRKRDPAQFDLDGLAEASEGYTGAEIEQAVTETLRRCFHDGKREPTSADLLDVLATIRPIAQGMGDKMDTLRQWAATARPASGRDVKAAKRPKVRTIEV